MDDTRCRQFFDAPQQPLHRRYEALRAYFVERRSLPEVARQFGLAHGTLRNLVAQFRTQCQAGELPPFSLPRRGDDPPASTRPPFVRRPRASRTAAP